MAVIFNIPTLSHIMPRVALLTSGGIAPCLSAAVGGLIEKYNEISLYGSTRLRTMTNPRNASGVKLEEDLEIDSLGIVEVVMAFEDEFGIEIDDEELTDVATVGQAVNLLHSKL